LDSGALLDHPEQTSLATEWALAQADSFKPA
jgi:hypothetical protein